MNRGLDRMSTDRTQLALAAAARRKCECNEYHGFVCSKHKRIHDLRMIAVARTLTNKADSDE